MRFTSAQPASYPRGAALIELLVVLPLLLVILGGIVDFSRSIDDRAALTEIARITARAASRTWVLDETSIGQEVGPSVDAYLDAAGYDSNLVQTQVRLLDLSLSGHRYTKGVDVTITALNPPRPYHFLPIGLLPPLTGRAFCRLENAPVTITNSSSSSY